MKQLYLDMNIYNRPFDDQAQVRIRLETIAIHSIIKMIKDKNVALLWSFMLEFENSLNPYEDIRMEIEILSALASMHIDIAKDILTTARTFEFNGIKSRDAIHLSCAIKGRADYFLTCDDRLIKRGSFLKDKIAIMNPIDFIRMEV